WESQLTGEFTGKLTIKVPEQAMVQNGDFKLSLIAESKDLASEPATVQLHWLGPPAPIETPMLYALIIGVGNYDKDEYDLGDFPARDVDSLVKYLLVQ